MLLVVVALPSIWELRCGEGRREMCTARYKEGIVLSLRSLLRCVRCSLYILANKSILRLVDRSIGSMLLSHHTCVRDEEEDAGEGAFFFNFVSSF